MGEIEAVGQMTQAAGPMSGDAAQRLNIENQLIAGDAKAACATPMAQNSPDPFWTKLMIVCQVIAGQNAQAMLNVDLLRERGIADTGFFVAVDYALGTRSTKPPANIGTDTLSQALLRAVNPKAGGTLNNETTPAQLRQIAANIAAPLAQRIEAAERGEALGVIDPRQLLELYQAGADAPGLSAPAKRRAQAVRDAVRASDVADKVKAMQAAFRAAEGSALFTTMARVLGEQLVKIFPEHKTAPLSADTAALVPGAERFSARRGVVLHAGRRLDHRSAIRSADRGAVAGDAACRQLFQHSVGAGLHGQVAGAERQASAWPPARRGAGRRCCRPGRAGRPRRIQSRHQPPVLPHRPLRCWRACRRAAQQGRVGESVALAAQAAGETSLTALSPATLARHRAGAAPDRAAGRRPPLRRRSGAGARALGRRWPRAGGDARNSRRAPRRSKSFSR